MNCSRVLLRITPGIDPHTYHAINTGAVDVKFGVPVETGQAMEFVRAALGMEHIEVAGLHCHVGSMVFDEDVFLRTVDLMIGFMAEVRGELGFVFRELNLGGGYGVRYTDDDPMADIPARIGEVAARLRSRLAEAGLPAPRFLMEPGRSIVADAGMTVYTVCSVKRIPGYKSYVITDGGMTDNPRFCLYGGPLLRERRHHPAGDQPAGRHRPRRPHRGLHDGGLQLFDGLELQPLRPSAGRDAARRRELSCRKAREPRGRPRPGSVRE